MPFVKCDVDGCHRKLQPLLKPDPDDRASWVYPECDVCFRPVCDNHVMEVDSQRVCDRCGRAMDPRQAQPELIDLGIRRPLRPA